MQKKNKSKKKNSRAGLKWRRGSLSARGNQAYQEESLQDKKIHSERKCDDFRCGWIWWTRIIFIKTILSSKTNGNFLTVTKYSNSFLFQCSFSNTIIFVSFLKIRNQKQRMVFISKKVIFPSHFILANFFATGLGLFQWTSNHFSSFYFCRKYLKFKKQHYFQHFLGRVHQMAVKK